MPPPTFEPLELKVGSDDFQGEHMLQTRKFLQGMMDRLTMSRQKYGSIHRSFPHLRRGIDNVELRLAKYQEDGNTEWLLDAANYCLIEFMCPSHPNAHFRSTSANESPGAVNADGSRSLGLTKDYQYKRQGD